MASAMTHEEMRAELIERAVTDEEFRQRLMTDPKAAVKEALGLDLPDAISVQVHEDTASTSHLVLPPAANLDEADLNAAAGGIASGMYRDRK